MADTLSAGGSLDVNQSMQSQILDESPVVGRVHEKEWKGGSH
jgi:hypothetical protein